MTERAYRKGTLLDRAHLYARGVGMVVCAIPSTHIIPLHLTKLIWPRFQREERLRDLHRMVLWARFCTHQILGIKLDVAGQEHLPRPSKGHMYVSNHQSYSDIPVLMSVLDTVAFLSKKLVAYIPFIGQCAYTGGTVFLERSSKESRKRALDETIRMCKESTAVVIFPEGTRSADGELREKIYPGALHGAFEQGIKAVPIGLHGTYKVIPKSMDQVHPGMTATVRIGAAIDPGDYGTKEDFVEAVWARISELHEEARRVLGDR